MRRGSGCADTWYLGKGYGRGLGGWGNELVGSGTPSRQLEGANRRPGAPTPYRFGPNPPPDVRCKGYLKYAIPSPESSCCPNPRSTSARNRGRGKTRSKTSCPKLRTSDCSRNQERVNREDERLAGTRDETQAPRLCILTYWYPLLWLPARPAPTERGVPVGESPQYST